MKFTARIAEVHTRIVEGTDVQSVSRALQLAQKQRHGTPTEFILLTLEPVTDIDSPPPEAA